MDYIIVLYTFNGRRIIKFDLKAMYLLSQSIQLSIFLSFLAPCRKQLAQIFAVTEMLIIFHHSFMSLINPTYIKRSVQRTLRDINKTIHLLHGKPEFSNSVMCNVSEELNRGDIAYQISKNIAIINALKQSACCTIRHFRHIVRAREIHFDR